MKSSSNHSAHPLGSRSQDCADLAAYRAVTIGLLRRYFGMSIELGRLPSMLGREFFRAKVTSYRMHSFEDAVIFVHDVERCLEKLDGFSQQVLARIVFQHHTFDEAGRLLACNERTVRRRYPVALDQMSEIFLQVGLLADFPCQGPKARSSTVTIGKHGK
jgi:hypothetical protein